MMEKEGAAEVRVSGVISVLSSGAVFTFSQHQFSSPHLLPITRIDTLHPQRSGKEAHKCVSQSTLAELKAIGV